MVDIRDVESAQVTIRKDGKVLWVNTDEGCILRIHNIGVLEIVDERVVRRSPKAG